MRSLPTRRSSRRAASRSASAEGRRSVSRRGVAIHIRYYQTGSRDKFTFAEPDIRDGVLTCQLIKRDIKQKHIDARLAEKAEQTPFGMVGDKLAHTFFRQVARLRYTRDLEEGSVGR